MKNTEIYKKENFIKKFCKEKGWNPNELTPNQMLIIVRQEGYKKTTLN